jgi:hypothetical protein
MKVYTLTQPAYGKQPGDTIRLNQDDVLVRLNVENGVLVEGAREADAEPPRMTCPLCSDDLEMKRPPKFESPDELEEHYAAKHQGFAVPAWSADNEGKVK